MIKTIIITVCLCALLLGAFISGFVVSSYFVTTPVLMALSNVLDTSYYQSGEILVLIKDSKGVIFRKFSSSYELVNLANGLSLDTLEGGK